MLPSSSSRHIQYTIDFSLEKMNTKDNYFARSFCKSPSHHRYYSSFHHGYQPRRNSYKMAIDTATHDHLQILYSNSSSISSFDNHVNTTRSLYTIHNGCSHCINDHIQRSISQPTVRSPDNDFLLENAIFLLDSPVHALRPAHHKSHETCSSNKPLPSTNSLAAVNDLYNENNDYLNSSTVSATSIYRLVFLRSFASVFALASLFIVEVLQTSIYSNEHSFQALLTFHLSSMIVAFIFAAHEPIIRSARYRWKLSKILAYDRCSQILIIFVTIFTSPWVIMQYFHSFYSLVLLSASISGICLTCMIIKTFDHFLQLSSSSVMGNMNTLTIRLKVYMFIYNCICHLALTIGGISFLTIIIFKQWKERYILVGFPSCMLTSCFQLTDELNVNVKFLQTLSQSTPINMTMYLTEIKQVWNDEPTRYIYFLILIVLTVISLSIQVTTRWKMATMSISKRLSILQYPSETMLNNLSKMTHYRNHLFALFLGFHEGYLFGSIIKFDVTCRFGLQHTVEMLIIYGLSATISSVLIALIIKRITIMTSVSFTIIVHSITISFLFLIQTRNEIYHIQPLTLRYILFLSYGIVFGLWSTIIIHSMCHSRKISSSSTFAQSLAFRSLGRIIAYTCALHLCQFFFFSINSISLLCLYTFIIISYRHCHQ